MPHVPVQISGTASIKRLIQRIKYFKILLGVFFIYLKAKSYSKTKNQTKSGRNQFENFNDMKH